MKLRLLFLFCATAILLGDGVCRAYPGYAQGDGEYLYLEAGEPKSFNLDPDGNLRLLKLRKEIWLLRLDEQQSEERIFLGKVDPRSPEAAEVIVLDANFDGRPEFLLKFDGSKPNQFYCLVNERGEPLGEALFADPDMEFANPTFQSSSRTLTAWDRSGGAAAFTAYKFRNGRYQLTEETEIIYEVSRLVLERLIRYQADGKSRTSVRMYGDVENKPVRLRSAGKTPLFAQPGDETPTRRILPAGQSVLVVDAAVGPDGHRLKIRRPDDGLTGWTPEEAFLILVTDDCFLAEAPGSDQPVQNNLNEPYIPAYTELPLLNARKAKDGQVWYKVYYLEGDVTGWIKQAETMAVDLPESAS